MSVYLMLPPGAEVRMLAAHLERIGCIPIAGWPLPERLPQTADIVITTVDTQYRDAILAIVGDVDDVAAPVVALAEYEDPSTLQVILELRAVAVIERPLKPFGILANLMIARDVWQRRLDFVARVAELEGRHLALSKVAVAKILVMQRKGLSDVEAHKCLQKMAMNSRSSLEAVSESVIASDASSGLLSALQKVGGK